MHCENFELQLQAMLDERRGAEIDAALTRHANQCPACHQLLADYTVLLGAVSLRAVSSCPEVAVPTDLADQVLSDLPRLRTSGVRGVLGSNRRLVAGLAVAASLMIATYFWIDYRQKMALYNDLDMLSVEAEVQRFEAMLPLLDMLDQQGVESVCRATGRSMATLPTTVWNSPSDPLLVAHTGWRRSVASGFRPLADSMVSALDALRGTLPSKSDSPIDTDPASTDTSRIDDWPPTPRATITA